MAGWRITKSLSKSDLHSTTIDAGNRRCGLRRAAAQRELLENREILSRFVGLAQSELALRIVGEPSSDGHRRRSEIAMTLALRGPPNIPGDVGWQAYSTIIYLSFVTLTLFD
jgi:hypothetical protein